MHPLGSRETADNIFYNRRDDRRNRIFQFTDHFRLTDERHLLYKQVDLDLTIDIRPEITIPYPFVDHFVKLILDKNLIFVIYSLINIRMVFL